MTDNKSYIDKKRQDFYEIHNIDEFLPVHLGIRCVLRVLPRIIQNKQLNSHIFLEKYDKDLLLLLIALYRIDQSIIADSKGTLFLGDRPVYIDKSSNSLTLSFANLVSAIYFSSHDPASDNAQAIGSYAAELLIELESSIGSCMSAFDEDITLAKSSLSHKEIPRSIWLNGCPSDFYDTCVRYFYPLLDEYVERNENIETKSLTVVNWYKEISEVKARLGFTHDVASDSDRRLIDALNRGNLIDSLIKIFQSDSHSSHLTVGLLGDWGSGKTRILNLLKERLFSNNKENNDNKVDFIWGEFNAWAYEHTDNIQAGMAHEIIQALTQYRISFKDAEGQSRLIKSLRFKVYRFWRSISWTMTRRVLLAADFVAHRYPAKAYFLGVLVLISCLVFYNIGVQWGELARLDVKNVEEFTKYWDGLNKKAFALFSVSLGSLPFLFIGMFKLANKIFSQPYTKELLTYVKLPSYAKHLGLVSEMRNDIALMCDLRLNKPWFYKKKRLVFVVDDLDRCSPEGIVKTLEAVRLILDIPGVTVILAVDQRIALAALAYHYREIQEFHTSNDAKTIARDYLGKIIQLPINIPEPNLDTVTGYMGYVWQDDQPTIDYWKSLINPENEVQEGKSNSIEVTKNKTDRKELRLEEIISDIPETTTSPKTTQEQILEDYAPEQKAAFVYWINQFQLTNPRQLKRLHNSYKLLQLVRGKRDKIVDNTQHLAFGYLITLIMLEFINNLTQLELSGELKSWMFNLNKYNQSSVNSQHINQQNTDKLLEKLNSPQLENTCKTAKAIIEKAAQHFFENSKESKLATKNQIHQLYEFVNAFVLPAIEVDMAHKP